MIDVCVSLAEKNFNTANVYVDRIGEFGSQTYFCETLGQAFQKVAEIAQMDNVLEIIVWN